MADQSEILCWLHIGDLHITHVDEQNHRDLERIVALTQKIALESLDFAVLPGDNADDGAPEQFALVRDAVASLPMKLQILPGDHDFKPRTLDAFHAVLGADHLPKSVTVRGHRCLFLDVVSSGSGGPTSAWTRASATCSGRNSTKPKRAARPWPCSCTPTPPIFA